MSLEEVLPSTCVVSHVITSSQNYSLHQWYSMLVIAIVMLHGGDIGYPGGDLSAAPHLVDQCTVSMLNSIQDTPF